MRKISLLAAIAMVFCSLALAGDKVTVLDGTGWKVVVEPDSMAKDKGEKEFPETLTFADGKISTSEGQKVGFLSSEYSASKSGEKDWTFKTEQMSAAQGSMVWTGTIHEGDINGKMIWTKKGGAVLTYTFKGDKLD